MVRPLRVVRLQPFLEQRADFPRQAQQHVAGAARAGGVGGFQQAFQLAVVDHRDHRRAQHTHRHARPTQHADRPQACGRRGGAGFEDALELVVEGGQADEHLQQTPAGQFAEQVEVAQDQ
ncbi:hypothetical protein D9M73_249650 [compost metagenome]